MAVIAPSLSGLLVALKAEASEEAEGKDLKLEAVDETELLGSPNVMALSVPVWTAGRAAEVL
jgi:hypothetical protein